MDLDSLSPNSQPALQTFNIPTLFLPDPLIPTPANSRESSISTACKEDSWPPKWAPPLGHPTTPSFSYEDLLNPTLDTLEGIPNPPEATHPSAPTKWPKPSLSLSNALTNARKTTAILHHLTHLLTALLTAQIASGCPMQIPNNDPSTNANANPAVNDAWILQVLLSLHPSLDDCPAALYALQRLCMRVCKAAADDLAALQDLESALASGKRIARFIAKWGTFPERAFEGVEVRVEDACGTSLPGETDAQGGEISIAGCLDFAGVFAKLWEGRKGIRVREGSFWRLLYHGRENVSSSSDGLCRLRERCRGNVAHVLALLEHVRDELAAELGRRANCTHSPNGCWKLGASGREVRLAQRYIEGLIEGVESEGQALAGWERGGVRAGISGGSRARGGSGAWRGEKDEEVWLLKRWRRLSEREGGWGWGLVMRADEIVRRICRGRWVDFGDDGRGGKRRGRRS